MTMMAHQPSDPAPPLELSAQTLGALPVVCHFLGRMRLGPLVERRLGEPDPRCALAPARAIGLVVRNLIVCHRPLYCLSEWAAPYDPALLGLSAEEVAELSDDHVGRALDRLFLADRATLITELMLGVISEFEVDCSQLHNDSTSITLHGDYRQADGHRSAGKPTPAARHGHNKDHRPELKQLLAILTVTADGALPLALRLADGNLTDDQTHITTWDGLAALLGHAHFLYVADCKLCTREQMEHIDSHDGRFVTVLPKSRKEEAFLRDWQQSSVPDWEEAERKDGKRKGDPDRVWWTAPAPIPSAEGYPIFLVRSSDKRMRDQETRTQKIERAIKALEQLQARLAGPKSRLQSINAVEQATAAALEHAGASRWITFQVTGTVQESYRQEKRGRPGQNTRYRRHARTRFAVQYAVDPDRVAYDAKLDGYFPLITNDRGLTGPEVLTAYRYQPNLEKRHHQLKSIQDATPVLLKSPERIDAIFCCHLIAMLCNCLIERQLRQSMARAGITELPLFPEQRACRKPTAARTLELFSGLQRHRLCQVERHPQDFPPQLTPLQTQLLELLDVPAAAYTG